MAITLSLGAGITVDQSLLAQNTSATGAAFEFLDVVADNDTSITAIAAGDTTFIPNPFETFLFAQGVTAPMQVALSGFTGAAGNTGADLLTISGGAYLDLAFTDAVGNLLGSAANLAAAGNWSGLYTLDNTKIFLYTDPTNNNIVLGRKGSEGPTSSATDDVPNSSGAIIFAAYLEETATGAKVWLALNAPLSHPIGGDTFAAYDEAVTLANRLWASASVDASFNFAGAPSGQNVFMMFKAGVTDVGVVVTGMDPDKVKGDTVNTSQASPSGGPTLGTNNQGVDAGEGIVLTFVTHPDTRYTVNQTAGADTLTSTEAGNENNILFGGLFAATGARIEIAQATPPNPQTITLKAFTTTKETGTGFADGLLDGNGNPVDSNTPPADEMGYIASVTVLAANGTTVLGTFTADSLTPNINGITANFTESDGVNDRSVEIKGVLAGSFIEYTVTGTHNRISIQNTGTGNATFDIGGLSLPNVQALPKEIGSVMGFEDDAPTALGSKTGVVDEDGLTGQSTGIAGGTDDVAGQAITATGLLKELFTTGTDGLSTFSVSNDVTQLSGIKVFDPANAEVPLTSKGVALAYAVTASGAAGTTLDTLTAYADADGGGNGDFDAGERAVFTLVLTNLADYNTAAYTFTLKDQLDHPIANTEDDLVLRLGSILKIADSDLDFTFAPDAALAITVDDDSPTISANVGELNNLVVDESVLGTDDTENYSSTFTSAAGADEDSTTSYTLAVDAGGPASGLVDTATGSAVLLFQLNPTTLEGRVGSAAGAHVFTVSVVGTTGVVTLDQKRAVFHDPNNGPNDTETLSADNLVRLVATITDKDGDTANATQNIGTDLIFTDDAPTLAFGNLIGTGSLIPQFGYWNKVHGADELGAASLDIALNSFQLVRPNGTTDNTGTFNFTELAGSPNGSGAYLFGGKLTADFDNNAASAATSVDFTLIAYANGTYALDLVQGFKSVIILDSSNGQLTPGGPDFCQTLLIPGNVPLVVPSPSEEIVFFSAKATATTAQIFTGITVGLTDRTEADLQTAPVGSYLDTARGINVSTSGIGVANNLFQGDSSAAITNIDESFVVNPESLLTGMSVFIDNSVAGYNTATEDLYYRVYYSDGSTTNLIEVNSTLPVPAGMLSASMNTAGMVYFDIVREGTKLIDAVQLVMGRGEIKIPVIQFTQGIEGLASDVKLAFTATIKDGDQDAATSAFVANLFANEPAAEALDYLLVGTSGSDAFNIDLSAAENLYQVASGFGVTDKLVLVGDAGATFSINNSGANAVVTIDETGIQTTIVTLIGIDLAVADVVLL